MYNGTIQDLENIVTNLMQQSAVANSTLLTENMLLVALNNTRRAAERAWDFYYSQLNVLLDIPAAGASLENNYLTGSSVTVSGTLNPNITGTFTMAGFVNGLPFFTRTVSAVTYFISRASGEWIITPGGLSIGSNFWQRSTSSQNPNGTYTPVGSYTGTATVSGGFVSAGVKRVQFVSLPLNDGTNQPIEYLDNDTWIARAKRQIGRQPYNPSMTLYGMGVWSDNPLAYQNAQSLFLYPPNQFTFPVVGVGLNILQFLPDYVNGSETDFFVQNAPDFLQWGACLEINRLWKEFVNRQEGNITDDQIKTNYVAAWNALIQWDISIKGGTANMQPIPPPPQIIPEPQAA